jgi:hypothetical protein
VSEEAELRRAAAEYRERLLAAERQIEALESEVAELRIWRRVRGFVREVLEPQGGIFGIARKRDGGWLVSSEYGEEAEDSPMAGAAIYGHDDDLDTALDQALKDAGR